jgi:protein-S-isoprenylcysteine O-methyltransferase Ste14
MKVISRLASLVMLTGLVVLIATGSFLSASPLVIACQVGALALAVWARRSFAPGQFRFLPTPRGDALVRRGPYRFIRHPMYSAALLLVWATVLGHWSSRNLAVGAVVTLVLIPRILDEERKLRDRYPEYADYARSTKALVPFVV